MRKGTRIDRIAVRALGKNMKKKLLIIVGAGASIDFGLPSVSDIDKVLDRCASKIFPLDSDPTSNLYRHCRDAIQGYYATAPKPMLREWVNFEEVLYQLNLLIPYLGDPNRRHGSNALLSSTILPEVRAYGDTRQFVNGSVLGTLTSTLMDALVDHFINACDQVNRTKQAELGELGQFLHDLRDRFEVGIITLNYDNVFTQAVSGLHTGFDAATGAFNPLSVLGRTDWGFIYHLHGSVHFAMTGTAHHMHEISWTTTPVKGTAAHASVRNTQASIEGPTYPISPIVAGYGKTQQILRQPFRTYFAQTNRLVHEADSLLFLGYGFGDLHLNSIFSEIRSRHRPVVLVDWAKEDEDPLPFRHDNWTYRLFGTLGGDAHSMSPVGHTAPADIAELKASNELEVSTNSKYPLAVWYNGFLAACRNSDKILQHLA